MTDTATALGRPVSARTVAFRARGRAWASRPACTNLTEHLEALRLEGARVPRQLGGTHWQRDRILEASGPD